MKEKKTERLHVRVPERLGQAVRDEAKKHGVKPSEIMRRKLEQPLEQKGKSAGGEH